MATLELQGFEDLASSLQRFAERFSEGDLEKTLITMANTGMTEIRNTGESMGVRDPMSDVHILDKMGVGKFKKTMTGGYVDVTFRGSRERNGVRTRNSEIAFVNEYGKRTQIARPFIGRALAEDEDEILAPAEDLLDRAIEDFDS